LSEAAPHANRLINEPSPYLQQHAHNPVDWYPWGDEAFARARAEDRPIFLSIGYSTCHWCHVMAHESFEDQEVAGLINRAFVPVKVDREERPDVDQSYMTVCQLLTGSGGWPLTIIATPEGKPFFAGTYIPKTSRFGRSGLLDLIPRIAALWKDRRDQAEDYAERVTDALRQASAGPGGQSPAETGPAQDAPAPAGGTIPGRELLDEAYDELRRTFDREHGGFGQRPKFPTPHHLTFLLRYWLRSGQRDALEMVETTLRAMRRGGMYDHLGHGFHRYSTDARWRLPHFEKMLYDQAMLVTAYAECFQATGEGEYRRTAEEVISYVRRVLTSVQGGFFSAEDADSEGEEGKFYVWETGEIRAVLGPDRAPAFLAAYGVKPSGNFGEEATGGRDGRNVLHLATGADPRAFERERGELFAHRERRARPSKDDKILTDWNGLMIAALGRAAQAFGEPAHARLAAGAAGFILKEMAGGDGRLLHRHRGGKTGIRGFLDDYALLVWGLLELYESTFQPQWLREAIWLTRTMVEQFEDRAEGAFFFTAADAQPVVARNKELQDGAVPSGNSVAILNLLRIARMTGDVSLEETAARALRAAERRAARAPSAFTHLLGAVDFAIGPAREVVVVGAAGGSDTREMLAAVVRPFRPNKAVLRREPGPAGAEIVQLAPFTEPLVALGGKATAYVCRGFTCAVPTTDPGVAAEMLQDRPGVEPAAAGAVPLRSQPAIAGPRGQP
jgi:hypothetical protein